MLCKFILSACLKMPMKVKVRDYGLESKSVKSGGGSEKDMCRV